MSGSGRRRAAHWCVHGLELLAAALLGVPGLLLLLLAAPTVVVDDAAPAPGAAEAAADDFLGAEEPDDAADDEALVGAAAPAAAPRAAAESECLTGTRALEPPLTVTYGRMASTVEVEMPLTSTRSSTVLKTLTVLLRGLLLASGAACSLLAGGGVAGAGAGVCCSRYATMAAARLSPTPGTFCSSSTDAALMLISTVGDGVAGVAVELEGASVHVALALLALVLASVAPAVLDGVVGLALASGDDAVVDGAALDALAVLAAGSAAAAAGEAAALGALGFGEALVESAMR